MDIWMGNEHTRELLSILLEKEREVVVRFLFYGETQLTIDNQH